jgi:hypothetical protein
MITSSVLCMYVGWDIFSWHDDFRQSLLDAAFQLHCSPTLLYCWQYFDVVNSVRTKEQTKWSKAFALLRGLVCIGLILASFGYWILYGVGIANETYWGLPTAHYNPRK